MKNKKGAFMAWFLIIILIGVAGYFAFTKGLFQIGVPTAPPGVVTPSGACDGISSVTMTYNDIDSLERGTDPATSLILFEKNGISHSQSVADDATPALSPLSKYKGLAGQTASAIPSLSYFGKIVEFETACSALDVQAELFDTSNASAPTITVINNDGATVNTGSSGSAQVLGASSDVDMKIKVRAPTRDCSAVNGAVVAFNFASANLSGIDAVNGLTPVGWGIRISSNSNASVNLNSWQTFEWQGDVGDGPGKLCNGKETEFIVKVKSNTVNPTAPDSPIIQWLAINYDLDAKTLVPIKGLYDEDSNPIFTGNGSAQLTLS